MFLKVYATESIHATLAGVDEKTFRKWTWQWIEALADLQKVDWSSRFDGANEGQSMFVSLDGTDFRINEPSEFDPSWYSHKFHGPGLRYEIGLCIRTGHIVWANGGVACGLWPDLVLARSAYTQAVLPGELTCADLGYSDSAFFYTPRYHPESSRRQKLIMARHETINGRLKLFSVLKQVFRHRVDLHLSCFYAVVNVVQTALENESPLYSI
ncbi:hypothetical protein LEN26_017765 [Aphanomyces euteiches]|nr:hypothetical protein LEN26_017765 [Aphanomyces euteiches]KAH9110646.1 hypothetical protein AeMF1_014624 [Aphanomyces euteiches]KAH9181383.1 hypothetical protein AeNC1_016641 [Aphanomyces euteiches]